MATIYLWSRKTSRLRLPIAPTLFRGVVNLSFRTHGDIDTI